MPRDFGLKDNELAKLRALFESVPELEAVYVFGSRARGDHKGTSDVDLAVRTSTDHSRVTSRLKGELEEMNIIHRFDVANLADLKEGSDFARRVHKEMRVMWRRWWRTVSISDVAENHDNLRKPLSSLERSSKKGAYPYYGAAGIIDYVEKWIFDGEYLLIAEDGSVCDDMGHPTLQRPKGKFWVSNHAHVLKCKSIIDQKYLYYFLKNQDIRAFVTGAVQPKLNQENLNKIAISWPPEVERARIAEILSSLDDKIELNRQMNKTLEQIAQALFKHWFIDFEFPNEEGKPYKSSGGKMVESELGPIPEGWRVGILKDCFDINPNRSLKKGVAAPYLDMSNMPNDSVRATDISIRPCGSGAKFCNGDTLIARITPCLENGKTCFVDFLEDRQVGWGSTEYIVLRPKTPFPLEYGYFLARTYRFRDYATSNMSGSSGRQRVSGDVIGRFPMAIPSDVVLHRYGMTVAIVLNQMKYNDTVTELLKAQRDLLLTNLLA